MVTIPTTAEIKAQILSYITAADTTTTLLPASFWDVLAGAMAGALYLVYKFGLWLYQQIFTSTMETDALALRSAELGLTKTLATKWTGAAAATGDDETVIESGKLCTYGDYVYQVTEDATVSGGSAALALESLDTGDDVNVPSSAELKWATPQSGLDKTLTAGSTTQEAEDAEEWETFRSEIKSKQQNKPQGGAFPDFVAWALEVAGIGECFVNRPSAGYVNVYPLTDDADPEDRIPSSALLSSVEDHINDDSTYPFGRSCTAIAMTELSFDVTFSNLSPNTSAVISAVETAVSAYIYGRRPQQYSSQTTLKNEITAGEITALAIAAGAKNITVTLYNSGGSDITDTGYTLEINELAEPGDYTWS